MFEEMTIEIMEGDDVEKSRHFRQLSAVLFSIDIIAVFAFIYIDLTKYMYVLSSEPFLVCFAICSICCVEAFRYTEKTWIKAVYCIVAASMLAIAIIAFMIFAPEYDINAAANKIGESRSLANVEVKAQELDIKIEPHTLLVHNGYLFSAKNAACETVTVTFNPTNGDYYSHY